jgi:hypothetical protein
MYHPTFIEFCLFISLIFNASLIYGAYLFANPIVNKRFQLWSLTRNIVEKFNDQIVIQGKLPVSQNLSNYSEELVKKVEDELLKKGYTVFRSDKDLITIY